MPVSLSQFRSIGVLPQPTLAYSGPPPRSVHSTFRGGVLGYGDEEEAASSGYERYQSSAAATTSYGQDARKSARSSGVKDDVVLKKGQPTSKVSAPFNSPSTTTSASSLTLDRPSLVPSCCTNTASCSKHARPTSSSSSSSFIPTPSQIKPNGAPEVAVGSLDAPSLPFDMALFPLEKCHYYTDKKPEVSE